MQALSGPKGGYHLAGGWVDDGVPVYYDGWDRLVAVSHRTKTAASESSQMLTWWT